MASQELAGIRNFYRLSETLGSAGQPTAEQLRLVKDAGYEVVINLAPSDARGALANERQVVEGLGLKYVHIPVIFTDPKAEEAAKFFAAMQAQAGHKVFVHCIANYRASAFIYLYRVTQQRVPEAEAAQDMHKLWTPNETWQHFIQSVLAGR